MLTVVAKPLDQHHLLDSQFLPLEDLLDSVDVFLLVDRSGRSLAPPITYR